MAKVTWPTIPDLPLPSCVILDTFLMDLSALSYTRGVIITHAHHGTVRTQLLQCLAHSRCSGNVCCIITAGVSLLDGLLD